MLEFKVTPSGSLDLRVAKGVDRDVDDFTYQLAYVQDGRAQGFETIEPEDVERSGSGLFVFQCFSSGHWQNMLFVFEGGHVALSAKLREDGEALLVGGGFYSKLFEPPKM